jgi:hypothetical protein
MQRRRQRSGKLKSLPRGCPIHDAKLHVWDHSSEARTSLISPRPLPSWAKRHSHAVERPAAVIAFAVALLLPFALAVALAPRYAKPSGLALYTAAPKGATALPKAGTKSEGRSDTSLTTATVRGMDGLDQRRSTTTDGVQRREASFSRTVEGSSEAARRRQDSMHRSLPFCRQEIFHSESSSAARESISSAVEALQTGA